jgi:hypothetical protein
MRLYICCEDEKVEFFKQNDIVRKLGFFYVSKTVNLFVIFLLSNDLDFVGNSFPLKSRDKI